MQPKPALRNAVKVMLPERAYRKLKSSHKAANAFLVSNNLSALATLFGSDKWNSHWYAQHYQRHFAHLRHRKITLLEIGIGGYDVPDEGGGSLRSWKWFFPNAQIIGIDLHDKRAHEEPRIRTFQGSQDDTAFLEHVVAQVGPPDIIIDDGSHLNAHVLVTFQTLFPLLKDGGTYIVEDTQTSYWPTWGGKLTERNSPDTSTGMAKSLVDGLNHVEFVQPDYAPTYYDRNVVGVHFYHNLVMIDKAPNNERSNMVTRGVLRD